MALIKKPIEVFERLSTIVSARFKRNRTTKKDVEEEILAAKKLR